MASVQSPPSCVTAFLCASTASMKHNVDAIQPHSQELCSCIVLHHKKEAGEPCKDSYYTQRYWQPAHSTHTTVINMSSACLNSQRVAQVPIDSSSVLNQLLFSCKHDRHFQRHSGRHT